MARHTVRAGDCVASLAAGCGSTVDAVWNDPDNAGLRERRESPYMLAPGDVVHLPDAPSDDGGATVSRGGRHAVRARVATVRLHLKLLDERWGEETAQGRTEKSGNRVTTTMPPPVDAPPQHPLANVAYRLEVGGRRIEGTTDGDGVLDERIDARATRAQLVLEPDTEHERTLQVHIGYLDPPSERSGIVQRLSNLGFPSANEAQLENMVAAFQKSRGLTVTGEIDDATRQRIEEDSGG